MIIKLVRHGESQQQTGQVNATIMGDYHVQLSSSGWYQSKQAGQKIGPEFIHDSLVYCSPYIRAKQTLAGIIEGSGVLSWKDPDPNKYPDPHSGPFKIYEDPELREIEFGYNKTIEEIEEERKLRSTHGWMFYRYKGGESPADGISRMSLFIDSMMRQTRRKLRSKILIISHGMTIRCFVTRFMHLTVEQFDLLRNPDNCDIITIGDQFTIEEPQFTSGKWAVSGLKIHPKST